MDLYTDEFFMKEAMKEANKAFEAGEVPVGAVMVCQNEITCRAHNQAEQLHYIKTCLLIVMTVLLSAGGLFGQDPDSTFQYRETGLNDFVITQVASKTKEEIYSKTLNWIKETYKNPDLVLKMKIENEKVRLEAIALGLLKARNFASNLSYVIEISFKDYKYKFEITSLLYENSTDYKKIPNFKTDSRMLKNFGTSAVDIERYFNSLNESLRSYVAGENKKSDW